MSAIINRRDLKIFKIPVTPDLMPKKAPFRYPSYSRDWGVEQDFLNFLDNSDF
jgi:hypothetical protein